MNIITLFKRITCKFHNYICIYKNQNVHIGSNPNLYGKVYCYIEKGELKIGNNFRVNSNIDGNPIGGDIRSAFVTRNGGIITIGNNVGISNSTIVASKSVTIEDDVLIGGSCKIYDTDFHSIEYEFRMQKPDIHVKSAPVLIKKGAFIGAHSIVLKGVTVGKKSIVGAGSVVTRDIPDGEIWAGNPARFIRKI